MKYFISLISALLFTFTVFAQGVLEIKQSRQTLKNLLADDQPMTVVYTAQNTGTQPVIITRVTPMTSLLKADWPKSPLLPGKSYVYSDAITGKFQHADSGLFQCKSST